MILFTLRCAHGHEFEGWFRDGDGFEAQQKAGLIELRRQIETNCDYVGSRFAEEARRIHYGEIDAHSIYGEASEDESRELTDEGISFGRIPWIPPSDT